MHLYPCMQVKKTNEAKEQEGKKRNGRTRQLVGRVRAPRMWEDGTEGMREREREREEEEEEEEEEGLSEDEASGIKMLCTLVP